MNPSVPTYTAEHAQAILDTYTGYEHEFVIDILGAQPWQKQIDIIRSVFDYKYTAVKTCNAVGKSFIAARIVITYLYMHPGSIVVTTAPTWRQVTDILWREVSTAVKKSRFKLTNKEVTQAGLNLDTDWYAVGLSTSRPENFFGYHADHILVVVDEAGGVDERIFKGVAAITPNRNARLLLIGNPTEPSGTFFDAFNKPELGYNRFTISAFDTPNFTSTGIKTLEDLLELYTPPPGVEQAAHTAKVNEMLELRMNPMYSGLIAPDVVYSRYHEWGTDSPAWEALIMGEFPSQAEQALIPANLIRMAMSMYGTDDASGKTFAELSGWTIPDGHPTYGQDMARFGSDLNVCTPRRGGWTDEQIVWNKKGQGKLDLMESGDQILRIIDSLDDNTTVNIDDTGNGGGTTDYLRLKSRDSMAGGHPAHRYKIRAYNFSSKDFMSDADRDKYYDITSLLYWNLRSRFMNKSIALHYDAQLFAELAGRRWGIVGGKIKVESKDEYKKRTGGKSPDKSDSLALAYAPETKSGLTRSEMDRTERRLPTARPTFRPPDRPITSGLRF